MLRVDSRSTVAGCLAGIVCLLAPAVCRGQASSYTISTAAGNGTAGFSGDNGTATGAKLNGPIQMAVDSSHGIYIADSINCRVRKLSGGKITSLAGSNTCGYSGDGASALLADLYNPYGVAVDGSGNLFIADLSNNVIREVSNAKISTFAGNASAQYAGDGGPAINASFYSPFGLAFDPSSGSLYIADSVNHCIRKVTPDGNVNRVAGNTKPGYSGDGGAATSAMLWAPFGIAVDAAGNLFIADSKNNRIRKVSPNGTITTVAGSGVEGFSGDGGLAINAKLDRPWDVKVDSGGDLFIADYNNNRIRMVTPDGLITTIAGSTSPGYSGDGGNATAAQMNQPTGLALDGGNVYIADSGNNVIRMLAPQAPSVGSVISAGAFGSFSTVAPGSWVEIYGTNLSIDERTWGSADFQGINAPTGLDGTTVTIGGQAAFVDFISGGQVNAQVPSGVGSGTQQVTVKTPAGSASHSVSVNITQPGLLAPPSFNIGGTQYVTALFTDGTYVLPPGAISGLSSRRAQAGDIITLYGIGFGAVSPNIPPGQIAQTSAPLVVMPQISFGQTPATVQFAGLAPGYVGLYQINVIVPSVPASDKVPVTFTLGGAGGSQTLFTAVQ